MFAWRLGSLRYTIIPRGRNEETCQSRKFGIIRLGYSTRPGVQMLMRMVRTHSAMPGIELDLSPDALRARPILTFQSSKCFFEVPEPDQAERRAQSTISLDSSEGM